VVKSSSFCTNCGISVKSTAKFCGSCGTAKEQIEDTTVRPSSRERTPRPRKKSREEELAEYEEEYLSKSKDTKSKSKTNSEQDSGYDTARSRRSMERPGGWKSDSTTLLLAIILGLFGLSGIGHLYLGMIGRGVGILIGGIILYAVGIVTLMFGVGVVLIIGYLVLFIWQIIDSRRLCREYNDYYEDYGQEPNW
jgi:hypothetical protein